jgi:hypothetical protein
MSLKNHRLILGAYVLLFLALLGGVTAMFAYLLAQRVSRVDGEEVWLNTHAFWIMRHVLVYFLLLILSTLCLLPLAFYSWQSVFWVKACMVLGVMGYGLAFLFLLNNGLKGMLKFMQHKAVF